jgi:hypothetical protein
MENWDVSFLGFEVKISVLPLHLADRATKWGWMTLRILTFSAPLSSKWHGCVSLGGFNWIWTWAHISNANQVSIVFPIKGMNKNSKADFTWNDVVQYYFLCGPASPPTGLTTYLTLLRLVGASPWTFMWINIIKSIS